MEMYKIKVKYLDAILDKLVKETPELRHKVKAVEIFRKEKLKKRSKRNGKPSSE